MARLRFVLPTTAEVAPTTAPKTIIQVGAPANQRVAIRGFSVSFDGVQSSGAAAEVQLCIQSSSGTASAATLGKDVLGTTEAIQSTGLVNFTAEPSITTILRSYNVHPQTGYERAFAEDEEIELSGGSRLGIRVILSSSGPSVHADLNAEE